MKIKSKKHYTEYLEFIKQKLDWKNHYKDVDKFQKHHIIPKVLGGSDDITNYVLLSKADHVVAHYLLYSAYGHKHDLMAMASSAKSDSATYTVQAVRDFYELRGIKVAMNVKYRTEIDEFNLKLHGI